MKQTSPPVPAHALQTPDWTALAEIEAANLIEQGDIGSSVRNLFCLGLEQPGVLSQGALAALKNALFQHALAKQLQAQPTPRPAPPQRSASMQNSPGPAVQP